MNTMRGLALIALLVGACKFTPGEITPDGPGGGPTVTVGFAQATTLADEESGTIQIHVTLSEASTQQVTVHYAVSGGTATKGTDFTETDGTLGFSPGDTDEVIDLTINPDSNDEPAETIELALSGPTQATLGTAAHTITIAASPLPRVSFTSTSDSGAENTSPTITLMLDRQPLVASSVDVVAGTGTATGGGVDFAPATATVSFAAGETSKQVTLTVNNDALDEDDENAVVDLANPVNLILASAATSFTHQIVDDDPQPTVSFASAGSTVAEGVGFIDLTISLSAASGKSITVGFSISGNATGTADYTVPTTSPITFAPGDTTKTIRVNVVQDTTAEASETVIVTLGTLTNVSAGTFPAYTLTISDDDSSCLGSGTYAACLQTPATAVDLTGTAINTDTDTRCLAPVSGWTGQPDSCFIVGTTITVSGATAVTGTKPLVLFSLGDVTINANLDVSSHLGGNAGPGSNPAACPAYTDVPADDTNGAGGGAGGSFRSAGGGGGKGNNISNTGGSATGAVGAPTVLRGGCTGQTGGNGNNGATSNGGLGGAGGGALYIVSGGGLTVASGVTVAANGAAGDALTTPSGGHFAGGGGGGSGGMIKLQVQNNVSVSGARFMANGGGGSEGGDNTAAGADGNDPVLTAPTTVAQGGTGGSSAGDGGDGFAGTTAAQAGATGGGGKGGGGGGGGGGHIESNKQLTSATVSTGP